MPLPVPVLSSFDPGVIGKVGLMTDNPPDNTDSVYFSYAATSGGTKTLVRSLALNGEESCPAIVVDRRAGFWTAKFFDAGAFGSSCGEVTEAPVLTSKARVEAILGVTLSTGDVLEAVQATVAAKVVQADGSIS